jgi:hypothetical protein
LFLWWFRIYVLASSCIREYERFICSRPFLDDDPVLPHPPPSLIRENLAAGRLVKKLLHFRRHRFMRRESLLSLLQVLSHVVKVRGVRTVVECLHVELHLPLLALVQREVTSWDAAIHMLRSMLRELPFVMKPFLTRIAIEGILLRCQWGIRWPRKTFEGILRKLIPTRYLWRKSNQQVAAAPRAVRRWPVVHYGLYSEYRGRVATQ